ncbi:hypothetical protein K438DRAFT_1777256 [Mycena galopus ATCC 62051]|nr:hypothetical protein K438DRAFT_1777256 [Mycena galopus ATCC 62051]
MTKMIVERYGSEVLGNLMHRFAEVSATRYQSFSYAAAELLLHHDITRDLIQDICDGKGRAGANHMETNIIRGLACPSTISEVAALAAYGLLVSWPYLSIIPFCPGLIFDQSVPDSELTIDGNPPINPGLLEAVRQAEKELPYAREMITALFKGCAEGWCQFTSEFVRGGPIDTLPGSLRHLVAISGTNDSNEGILGSIHVAARFHPNISTSNFSARKRVRRNDTEIYSEGYDRAGRPHIRYAKKVAERIATKGREARDHREALEEDRRLERARLAAVGLELDLFKVNAMTVAKLRDQLRIFKFIVEDPELRKKAVWGDKRQSELLVVVVAAVNRCKDKYGNSFFDPF